MMDWLAIHGSIAVLIVFFVIFMAFGFWAYRPSRRKKFESYGCIPLKENRDGE